MGAPTAGADTESSGDGAVLSGNQVVAEVNAPVNVCGNAVAVGGVATGSCDGADPKEPEDPKDPEEPEDPKDPKEPEDPKDPKEPEDPKDPKDPKEAPDAAEHQLPVTGTNLLPLVAAAAVAIGAGLAALFLGRRSTA